MKTLTERVASLKNATADTPIDVETLLTNLKSRRYLEKYAFAYELQLPTEYNKDNYFDDIVMNSFFLFNDTEHFMWLSECDDAPMYMNKVMNDGLVSMDNGYKIHKHLYQAWFAYAVDYMRNNIDEVLYVLAIFHLMDNNITKITFEDALKIEKTVSETTLCNPYYLFNVIDEMYNIKYEEDDDCEEVGTSWNC